MLDVMTMDEEEEIVANDFKGCVFELASVIITLNSPLGSTSNPRCTEGTNWFRRVKEKIHNRRSASQIKRPGY